MTSLRVICGLGPPNQKSWLRLYVFVPGSPASKCQTYSRYKRSDANRSDAKTRKKTKAEITDSPRSNKRYVIIPYFPGLSEKIRQSSIPHGVKTIMKPGTKLGRILSSHKDKIQSNKRQGAIYQIPYKDCNMVYIGKTK